MKKLRIYFRNSASGRAMFDGLKDIAVRKNRFSPIPRNCTIINWGQSRFPFPIFGNTRVLNSPRHMDKAINKIKCLKSIEHFTALSVLRSNLNFLPYTTTPPVEWLQDGHTVMARTLINSCQGKGIKVVQPGETIPDAPLYTKYIKPKHEMRYHVFRGNVFDRQEKKRRRDTSADPYIRNHKNGYIFCREDIYSNPDLEWDVAKVVQFLGLDFGAVDVVIDDNNTAYILEVNTAPGLAGTTLAKYIQQFRNYYNMPR